MEAVVLEDRRESLEATELAELREDEVADEPDALEYCEEVALEVREVDKLELCG